MTTNSNTDSVCVKHHEAIPCVACDALRIDTGPEEIANHTALLIDALRKESEKYRHDAFVSRMLTSEHVIAAAVGIMRLRGRP